MSTKLKDKDEGLLGDGLAELARKQLYNRQAQLDDILNEATGVKPKTAAPEKVQKPQKMR